MNFIHEFLIGERVPTAAEIAADEILAAEEKAAKDAALYESAMKFELSEMRGQYLAGEIPAGQEIVPEVVEQPPKEVTGYQYTKYTSDDNQIILVTYENGTSFILNYNNFAITTVVDGTTYTVDGYGYVVID